MGTQDRFPSALPGSLRRLAAATVRRSYAKKRADQQLHPHAFLEHSAKSLQSEITGQGQRESAARAQIAPLNLQQRDALPGASPGREAGQRLAAASDFVLPTAIHAH